MAVGDVLQTALRFDECLIRLYQGAADRAASEEVRHLFQELLELEKREEVELSRSALEVEQS